MNYSRSDPASCLIRKEVRIVVINSAVLPRSGSNTEINYVLFKQKPYGRNHKEKSHNFAYIQFKMENIYDFKNN